MAPVPVAIVARPRRSVFVRHWRSLLALLAGGVLAASIALMIVLSDGGPKGRLFDAGDPGDFQVGDPVHFEDREIWVVRMEGEIFIALSDREPGGSASRADCRVEWAGIDSIVAEIGLFKGSCTGSLFDISGMLFFGPAPRGMDRFPARIEEGRVRVDVGTRICGNGLPAQDSGCLFPRPLQ